MEGVACEQHALPGPLAGSFAGHVPGCVIAGHRSLLLCGAGRLLVQHIRPRGPAGQKDWRNGCRTTSSGPACCAVPLAAPSSTLDPLSIAGDRCDSREPGFAKRARPAGTISCGDQADSPGSKQQGAAALLQAGRAAWRFTPRFAEPIFDHPRAAVQASSAEDENLGEGLGLGQVQLCEGAPRP